ncbi:HEAT repeat domain-containing protein [Limnoglobus roseus]|uniref:HEAT repeat domain-containing protein n=1 Tax=Limnoglobus roseus TaxID=2598579 RepID=A0A5C1AIV8_9BACT|nr:HEAT repeat domain-containing protein [Limnoglobus roseus]QEL18183.1 HEAT repeat domain-containing protein [Limnoglobus roseus]
MDIPAKKLLKLLSDAVPVEVRAASTLVVGELGLRDAEVAAAVAELLTDPAAEVRTNAIKAAGQLKIEKSLPVLLERISHGGPEASLAAEAAAALGAKGVKGLQDLMHKVVPGVRKYIAAALTSAVSHTGDAAGLAVLVDHDPQVAASASSAIIAKIPTLTPDRKAELAKELTALVKNKKKPIPATSEVPVARLLVALNQPAAAEVMWDRILLPHPPEVRTMALQAVGGWTPSPNKEQLKRLFHCASEPDFRIAAPALAILNKLPVTDKTLEDWIALLHAPDIAARRLAMDKIGDRDTNEVAEGLLAQFHHSDRSVRDTARSRLQKLKSGRKALVKGLIESQGHDETWQFARTIATFGKELTPSARTEIFETTCAYLEKSDHRTDPFLFVLREIDAGELQDKLVEQAVGLRKKKKYDAAMTYLKAVARDPSVGFAVRLEIALNGLKVSRKEADPHSRESDPCLRNFDTLFQQDAEQLVKELDKAKFLDEEDLFYVGFHFAEQIGRPQQLGVDLLKLVVKRNPKSEAGKSAKNKLKSVGA